MRIIILEISETHKNEGNALFLILIAVALFGALSYAIVKSSQGSGSIEAEQEILRQAEVQNYQAALQAGRQRLSIIGSCSAIDYTPPQDQTDTGDKSCFMFHPDGAGVGYRDLLDACAVTGKSLSELALGEPCGAIVFAGTSSGKRLYVLSSGQGQITWAPNTNYNATSATSGTNGFQNTQTLLSSGFSPFPAAEACVALGPKWYLPSSGELNALYTNRTVGSLNGTFQSAEYWSSTDHDANQARALNFADGSSVLPLKLHSRYVRCVRSD